MKLFHSIESFHTHKKTIITLGAFDGVHIGHQKIIEKLIHNANSSDSESLILTFFPHPRMVLQEQSEMQLLNTIEERAELLEKTGLDNLIIHPFDKVFSRLTAEEFVKNILVDRLKIKKIIIGHDHRFGKNRTADIDDLIVFGKKYAFEVEQISAQEIQAVSVSSTKIRTALEEGNIHLANQYLGYSYFLTGTVQQGKQLGRTIGFPTANLKIKEDYKLIPKSGVYVVQSTLRNNTVFGIMNIGTNPTVNGKELSIEIHYLDFEANLYSQKIEVSLLHYIRSEQKFESVTLLKDQLEKDKLTAIAFINKL
ncbi:bifunctional riboflavin kinase/FAD synthetase [Flavobacterium psychrotolerans]|uniref:Riboflavin biosynthesis protein n=1 Tax=Flavobacterium psychrotolerans TaxID=2169410 RepID=A0A2U1JJX3_9FLAO|nr:bifunctional riboflavin kinase/FAD synthetase [Flavobacterium psychrotolerans]PWA05178.1 riboflavin biosynthesis protein RibF [Flavobacterium psychrotolerans]